MRMITPCSACGRRARRPPRTTRANSIRSSIKASQPRPALAPRGSSTAIRSLRTSSSGPRTARRPASTGPTLSKPIISTSVGERQSMRQAGIVANRLQARASMSQPLQPAIAARSTPAQNKGIICPMSGNAPSEAHGPGLLSEHEARGAHAAKGASSETSSWSIMHRRRRHRSVQTPAATSTNGHPESRGDL